MYPILYAAERHNFQIIDYLLENGAEITASNSDLGGNFISYALFKCQKK